MEGAGNLTKKIEVGPMSECKYRILFHEGSFFFAGTKKMSCSKAIDTSTYYVCHETTVPITERVKIIVFSAADCKLTSDSEIFFLFSAISIRWNRFKTEYWSEKTIFYLFSPLFTPYFSPSHIFPRTLSSYFLLSRRRLCRNMPVRKKRRSCSQTLILFGVGRRQPT